MLALLILLGSAFADSNKCRVLALGGGSDHGAYQAGGIIGLIKSLPLGEAQWDVVTGIGVGAINGLIVSQSSKGSESELAANLASFWTAFNTKQFYKEWFGGYFTGYFYRTGFFNTEPLIQTVKNLQTGPFQRYLGVGATDLISGSYVIFNSTGQTSSNMTTGIMASFSESGTFPIVPYKTLKLVTGSLKFAVDIVQGIKACMSMGFTENNIVMDVVLSAGKSIEEKDVKDYKTLRVYFRYLEISSYDNQMFLLENAALNFPQVTIRSCVINTSRLGSPMEPYNYSKRQRLRQLRIGETDAKAVLGL